MPDAAPPVNRVFVGILSLACLVIGALLAVLGPADDNQVQMWSGSFVRVGVLMGAFWLALPRRGRAAAWANLSPWWLVGVTIGLLFVVRQPRILIPMILAIVILLAFLPKSRSGSRSGNRK